MEVVDHNWSETEPARRGFSLGWPLMLFLGWLVFELTADAALTAVVACAKFGWNDWLTARWIRRADPIIPRARACAWLYRAAAFWRVAVAATCGVFLLGMVAPRNQPAPRSFTFICVEALIGFAIAAVVTTAALFLASCSSHRIWIHSDLHLCRQENRWPPARTFGRNGLHYLVLSALIFWLLPLVVVAIVMICSLLDHWQPPWIVGVLCLVFMFVAVLLVFPIMLFWLGNKIARYCIANTAEECWPEIMENVS